MSEKTPEKEALPEVFDRIWRGLGTDQNPADPLTLEDIDRMLEDCWDAEVGA